MLLIWNGASPPNCAALFHLPLTDRNNIGVLLRFAVRECRLNIRQTIKPAKFFGGALLLDFPKFFISPIAHKNAFTFRGNDPDFANTMSEAFARIPCLISNSESCSSGVEMLRVMRISQPFSAISDARTSLPLLSMNPKRMFGSVVFRSPATTAIPISNFGILSWSFSIIVIVIFLQVMSGAGLRRPSSFYSAASDCNSASSARNALLVPPPWPRIAFQTRAFWK